MLTHLRLPSMRSPSAALWALAAIVTPFTSTAGLAENIVRQQGALAQDQAIDVTVKTLAASGLVPIPPKEIETIAPVLKCMARGDKDVLGCGKEAVYHRVLGPNFAEAAPVVECIMGGKAVATCATDAALAQLPPEARAALTCGSDIANCAQDAVIARLPPEAQALARCAQTGGDPMECALKNATGDAKNALQNIQKATDPITGSNILGILDAVQKEEWDRLALLAGKEAARVATCAVLEVVLIPGPHQAVLCESAGNLINKRVGSARDLINEARAGDIGGMLGTIANAGLIDRQCAFVQALDADVEEALCGTTAKIIDAGANNPLIAGIVTNALTANPALALFVGGAVAIFGKDKDCKPPGEYFANNYMQCQHRAVFVGLSESKALADLVAERNGACVREYKRCHSEGDARKLCDGLGRQFASQSTALTSAYNKLASGHARGFRDELTADRSRICGSSDRKALNSQVGMNFVSSCQRMLEQVRPLKNSAGSKCEAVQTFAQPVFGLPDSAQRRACETAGAEALDQVLSEVCVGAGICFPVEKEPEIYLR